MKKTFNITHPKIKLARLFEGVKHDVKKYVKRERNKQLPAGVDFWDFDCKYGITEAESEVVHLTAMNKHIDEAEKLGFTKILISKHNKIAVKNSKIELVLVSKIEDIVSELLD